MSFKFNTKQNIYTVGKAKVGGQPGELPTFLIGSIFWLGQKMVQDANKGIFDAKEAEKIINTMQTQSEITGVQFAFDIVGTTDIAFEKYIDFVSKHSDAPLMLDAMSPKTRMIAAQLAKKMGLADRCLYNSVYKGVTDAELANLKDSGIKMSIVLADDPKDTTMEGKMKVIQGFSISRERWNHKATNRHSYPSVSTRHGHCSKNHTNHERKVWAPCRLRQRKRCHNHGLG